MPVRRMLPVVLALLLPAVGTAEAGITTIGSMADWQASPSQTLDDKTFTWLSSGTGWGTGEVLSITSNPILDLHSMNFDQLTLLGGPLTLTVAYRIDILSNNVFDAVAVDSDTLSPRTTVYKDVFSTFELLQAGGPGGGDLAAIVSISGTPAVASLPGLQHIWVRDTIQLDATGQLNSVSNSFYQVVPEPGALGLVGLAGVLTMATGLRSRWRRSRGS